MIEAMKQALDALDNMTDAQSNPERPYFPTIHDFGKARLAAVALRQAIEQAEKVAPVVSESELKTLAAKGCGDCFPQDCIWPECSPRAKELTSRQQPAHGIIGETK